MTKIYGNTYAVTPATTINVRIPVKPVVGVTFENNSGSFLLVRIGSQTPPTDQNSADETIPPYTSSTFPTTSHDFGIAVVANLAGLSIPSTVSQGRLGVSVYNEKVARRSEQLVGAPSNIAPTYAPDVFPYGIFGEALTASAFYNQFLATGYGVLRFNCQNFGTQPARFNVQVTTSDGVQSIDEQHNFILGPTRAGVKSIPLRRFAGGGDNEISVLPRMFIDPANAQEVRITPVLTQSGDFGTDIPEDGAYQTMYVQKALTATVPIFLVAGPIWVFWVKQTYTVTNPAAPAPTPVVAIAKYNTALTVRGYTFIERAAGLAVPAEHWGPVPFASAHFVGANESLAAISASTLAGIDNWVGYCY